MHQIEKTKAGHKRRDCTHIEKRINGQEAIEHGNSKSDTTSSQTLSKKVMTSMRLFITVLCFCAFASGAVSAESTHEPTDESTAEDFGFESRIVGGDPAAKGKYPFFTRWGGCGASLVWFDVLLSAAHVSSKATPRVE